MPALIGRESGILPQATEHVFHVNDRVVDQGSNRDCHAAEGHRIDARAACLESQHGSQKRKGYCRQSDQCGSKVREEQKHDHNDEEGAISQGVTDVPYRDLDKVCLPKDPLVDDHTFRQARLNLVQDRVDFLG